MAVFGKDEGLLRVGLGQRHQAAAGQEQPFAEQSRVSANGRQQRSSGEIGAMSK